MKNTTIALTLGLVLSLAGAPAARAMSEFASLSIRPLWPSTPNPGNVLLYEVAVERVGQGMLEINLSCDGLPDGCVATFGDDPIRFTGRDPRYQYFLMTVNCNQPTAVDTYAFTITGTSRRQSITIPNPFRLPVRLGTAAPNLVALELRSSGDVEVRGLGSTGQSYQIESTSDLNNPVWTARGSCTADGNGRFTFVQANGQSAGGSAQFYRAVRIEPPNP